MSLSNGFNASIRLSETREFRSFASRVEWLEGRRGVAGGSDVAKIVGLAPEAWGSPLSVWMSKTGVVPIVDDPTPWQEWGHRHEPAIARAWGDQMAPHSDGCDGIWRLGDGDNAAEVMVVADGWRGCTPDRIAHVDGEWIAVELKTVAERMSADWADGVPDYYRAQALWTADVLGVDRVDVAVLVGLSDFRIHTIRASEHADDLAWLKAETAAWWERHVVGLVAPPAVAASDVDAVKLRFPRSVESAVELDDEAVADLAQLVDVSAQLKRLESAKKVLQARIGSVLGDAERGTRDGRTLVTWRSDRTPCPAKERDRLVEKRDALDAEIAEIDAGTRSPSNPTRRFLSKAAEIAEVA